MSNKCDLGHNENSCGIKEHAVCRIQQPPNIWSKSQRFLSKKGCFWFGLMGSVPFQADSAVIATHSMFDGNHAFERGGAVAIYVSRIF